MNYLRLIWLMFRKKNGDLNELVQAREAKILAISR